MDGHPGSDATSRSASASDARQRLDRLDSRGAHRAARVGVVLVSRRIQGRAPGDHRRLALGRAHELQGDHEYSARPGEGDHRAVWRKLERLHLDRPDHVSRNSDPRRARTDAVHRIGAHGALSLRSGRLRIRAHGDHLGAAGRRKRSGSAPRSGADGSGVQRPSIQTPNHWMAVGSADDDARGSVRLLPSLLHPEQRDARDRRRCRYGQRLETCGPSLWGDRRGGRSRSTADD